MNIQNFIRSIPDFPKPGILFRDISPLLLNFEAIEYISLALKNAVMDESIKYIAGIESRGFIIASFLSIYCQRGIIPIRKAGKLPPPVHQISYDLEYGSASMEMAPGKGNIVIIDDVLATGGTLDAAIRLAGGSGYTVKNVAVLIDLTFLNSFRFNGKEVFSLVRY